MNIGYLVFFTTWILRMATSISINHTFFNMIQSRKRYMSDMCGQENGALSGCFGARITSKKLSAPAVAVSQRGASAGCVLALQCERSGSLQQVDLIAGQDQRRPSCFLPTYCVITVRIRACFCLHASGMFLGKNCSILPTPGAENFCSFCAPEYESNYFSIRYAAIILQQASHLPMGF
jgi:hypothetical protein